MSWNFFSKDDKFNFDEIGMVYNRISFSNLNLILHRIYSIAEYRYIYIIYSAYLNLRIG